MIHQLNIKKTKKGSKRKLMKIIKVFFNKEKNEKPQYGQEQYKNPPEDEKQRLVEYRKKYQ